jgi:hypothetical protein
MRHQLPTVRHLAAALIVTLTACTTNDPPDTAASPVQAVSRSTERVVQSMASYDRKGEDGTTVARVLAPAPQVWEALKATFEARKVNLTIADRAAGRMGDTAMVIMRSWNEKQGSYYFSCGQNIMGQRADNDRLKAVVLAQLTRMHADSIAISVHMSAFATPVGSGSSTATAQCASTGRGEADLLDDVMRRLGVRR